MIDEIRDKLAVIFQDLEVYINHAQTNETERIRLEERDLELRQTDEALVDRQNKLEKERKDFESQKEVINNLALKNNTREVELEKREKLLKDNEALIIQTKQELDVRARAIGELQEMERKLQEQESVIKKMKEADNVRKEMLDIREASLEKKADYLQRIIEEAKGYKV